MATTAKSLLLSDGYAYGGIGYLSKKAKKTQI
jgi:hypothetical protein